MDAGVIATLAIVGIFLLYLALGYTISYAVAGKQDDFIMCFWPVVAVVGLFDCICTSVCKVLQAFGLWIHKKFVKKN